MDNGASSYRRFLTGDNDGLSEIVREYSDGLIFYINSFVRNISTAEEIMEDVFVEIALKKPKFSGKSSFKTWLYTIARNISIDSLKKKSRYSDTPVDEMYDLSDEHDLENSYIREERKIYLHHVLSRLIPDYRQVLYLIFFEGFSNSEAAKIMKKMINK